MFRWSFGGASCLGGCRCSFYCCVSCGFCYADRFVSSSDHTYHPDHRHNDHNRRSGHRDSDHGGHLDGSRRPGVVYPVIVVDRYLGRGRNIARPNESMYSWARSDGRVLSLCD